MSYHNSDLEQGRTLALDELGDDLRRFQLGTSQPETDNSAVDTTERKLDIIMTDSDRHHRQDESAHNILGIRQACKDFLSSKDTQNHVGYSRLRAQANALDTSDPSARERCRVVEGGSALMHHMLERAVKQSSGLRLVPASTTYKPNPSSSGNAIKVRFKIVPSNSSQPSSLQWVRTDGIRLEDTQRAFLADTAHFVFRTGRQLSLPVEKAILDHVATDLELISNAASLSPSPKSRSTTNGDWKLTSRLEGLDSRNTPVISTVADGTGHWGYELSLSYDGAGTARRDFRPRRVHGKISQHA